jgi:hypothetical protein
MKNRLFAVGVAVGVALGCWYLANSHSVPSGRPATDMSAPSRTGGETGSTVPRLTAPQQWNPEAEASGSPKQSADGEISPDGAKALQEFLDAVTKLPVGKVSEREILQLTVQLGRSHPRTVLSSQDTLKEALPANCWINALNEAARELAKDPARAPLSDLFRTLAETETPLGGFLGEIKPDGRLPLLNRILSEHSTTVSTLLEKGAFSRFCSFIPEKLPEVFDLCQSNIVRKDAAVSIVEASFARDNIASFSILDHLPTDVLSNAQSAYVRSFLSYDMNAAISWVNQIEDQPTRDRLLGGTIASIAAVDLNAAKRWAESLVDQDLRKRNLEMLARMEARRKAPR